MGCSTSICFEDSQLRNCTTANTPKFYPPIPRGYVIDVYDGDTITVAARLNGRGPAYKFSVRLQGIDCAELRGSSAAEKAAGLAARDALRERILGKFVKIQSDSTDKYGRVLAAISLGSCDISEWLIEEGFAVAYDGGTKPQVDWARLRPEKSDKRNIL